MQKAWFNKFKNASENGLVSGVQKRMLHCSYGSCSLLSRGFSKPDNDGDTGLG